MSGVYGVNGANDISGSAESSNTHDHSFIHGLEGAAKGLEHFAVGIFVNPFKDAYHVGQHLDHAAIYLLHGQFKQAAEEGGDAILDTAKFGLDVLPWMGAGVAVKGLMDVGEVAGKKAIAGAWSKKALQQSFPSHLNVVRMGREADLGNLMSLGSVSVAVGEAAKEGYKGEQIGGGKYSISDDYDSGYESGDRS
jgi:hypothetical protein